VEFSISAHKVAFHQVKAEEEKEVHLQGHHNNENNPKK
jgi:hypothetical protein